MFLSEEQKQQLEDKDPSKLLCLELSPFVEMFSFIEVTLEKHPDLPYKGFRIVPDTRLSTKQNLVNIKNSFPEFFLNRVLPYLHYFTNRGDSFNPVENLILVIVYFDYVVQYKVKLHDMDMLSPCMLKDFTKDTIKSILEIDNLLAIEPELSTVSFGKPVYNRENILKEIEDEYK